MFLSVETCSYLAPAAQWLNHFKQNKFLTILTILLTCLVIWMIKH